MTRQAKASCTLMGTNAASMSALAIFHQVNEIYSRVNCVFEEKSNDAAALQATALQAAALQA